MNRQAGEGGKGPNPRKARAADSSGLGSGAAPRRAADHTQLCGGRDPATCLIGGTTALEECVTRPVPTTVNTEIK